MKLDKELYQQAQRWHREWNQEQLAERARNAGKRPSKEGWEQYLSLYRFFYQTNLHASVRARERKIAAIEQYYARVDRMERWRQACGRRA